MALKDTINQINAMRKEQKIIYAKEAVKEIEAYGDKHNLSEIEVGDIFFSLVKLFTYADHVCTSLERELFNKTFGVNFTEEQFEKITEDGNDKTFKEQTREMILKMDTDTQMSALIFGLSLMTIDNSITESEEALISEIFAK